MDLKSCGVIPSPLSTTVKDKRFTSREIEMLVAFASMPRLKIRDRYSIDNDLTYYFLQLREYNQIMYGYQFGT